MDAFLAGTDTPISITKKNLWPRDICKEQKIDRRTDIRYRIWKPFRSNLNFPKQEKNAGEMQEMEGLFLLFSIQQKIPRKTTLEMPRILDAILQAVLSSKQNW